MQERDGGREEGRGERNSTWRAQAGFATTPLGTSFGHESRTPHAGEHMAPATPTIVMLTSPVWQSSAYGSWKGPSRRHTYKYKHTHTHTHTHTNTQTREHTQNHKIAHTHSRTRTHARTHKHKQQTTNRQESRHAKKLHAVDKEVINCMLQLQNQEKVEGDQRIKLLLAYFKPWNAISQQHTEGSGQPRSDPEGVACLPHSVCRSS